MTVERTFDAIGEAPLSALGTAVLRRILLGNSRSRRVYTALMRAADRSDVRSYMIRATEVQLVHPIAERIGGPTAQYRASLIAAQVSGLLNALWILEDPALTARPVESLIETYGRALQALVDSD